jgi:cholesterol transport system auxiliary component
MKKRIHTSLTASLIGAALMFMLSGCGSVKAPSQALYDLGPLPSPSPVHGPALRPVNVADINIPSWLDTPEMFYRLAYLNSQQPHPYAESRWTMAPAQLFAQRLKSRIAQAGGAVVTPIDASNVSLGLHLDADDFSQIFTQAGQSTSHVAVRASLIDGRTLVAQQTFEAQAGSSTADAAGGAQALSKASDAVIDQILQWLANAPTKK